MDQPRPHTELSPQTESSLDEIRLILRDLLKVIKVVWMYPPDNPLPQSMRQSFAGSLADLAAQLGGFTVKVQKSKLLCGEEVVFEDTSREDALAALFFGAGITEFTFKPILSWENVFALLKVIKRHQNREPEATDLATALWEADITGFNLRTIEDIELAKYDPEFSIQEFHEPDDSSPLSQSDPITNPTLYEALFVGIDVDPDEQSEDSPVYSGRISIGDNEQSEEFSASGSLSIFFDESGRVEQSEADSASRAMGYDDLPVEDTPHISTDKLFDRDAQLSGDDLKEARSAMERDGAFDMYESTLELLKELIHQETDLSGLNETATICERHLATFLTGGRFGHAVDLLTYSGQLARKIASERPMWAERLRQITITASSRDRMHGLAFALNEHARVTSDQLLELLNLLGPEALTNAAELLPTLLHDHHSNALISYLADRGRDNVGIIARGMYDKRPHVVRNAVVVLSKVGTPEALNHLEKAVEHPDRDVRLELVISLRDSPSDRSLPILARFGYDQDEEIRSQAINSIVCRRGVTAFETITDLISDDRFDKLEPEAVQALLNAYSALGGEHALDYLSALINRYNLLRDSRISLLRRAALDALVYNQSDACEKLLLKLAGSWRPEIKHRAGEILHRRREYKYGESND
jgi:HEAT repeat protein